MKIIGITQRVEPVPHYSERRDCLDQRWTTFISELGYLAQPLPNLPTQQVPVLIENTELDAIFLSGGNTIAGLDPAAANAAPERDAFEATLIDKALEKDIPVIGICRGMQMLNFHLGGTLVRTDGHAGGRHPLDIIRKDYAFPGTVNSYHNWVIPQQGLAKGLTALARDDEGNIEAFEHTDYRLSGIMWHPEREYPFDPLDIQFIKKFLS